MIKAKTWYKSKTIILAFLLAVLEPVLRVFPELKGFLGDHYGIALAVLSAVIAGLRFITEQPITLREDK